jgi:opacity protein-like surface antigen
VSLARAQCLVAGAALFALGAVPGLAHAERSAVLPEIAYNYGEIETPRIAGTGGAQRALSNSVSSLFINPANMVASRVYHLGAFAQIWPEAQRQSYGAVAVDSLSSSTRLAGGLGATYNLEDPEGLDRTWTDLRFALAFPFSDQFFAGAGGRYLMLTQDGYGPFGPSPASGGLEDEQIVKGFAFDAGVTLKPSKSFAISLVGNNLGPAGHGFQPTSVGGGIGFGTDTVTLEADVVTDFVTWDETTLRAMVGGELLVAGHFALRAGYRYDRGAKAHAPSLGVGYTDKAFSLDLSMRHVFAEQRATAVVFGFVYHLESTGLTPSPGDTF